VSRGVRTTPVRRLGAALLVLVAGVSHAAVAQLARPTLERRTDLALDLGVVQVRDSVGTRTVSVVGGELAFGHFDGAWGWGPAIRLWIIPADRGVSGAGLHALVRASRVLGDAPMLELRGALGIGLSSVTVQRTALDERSVIGFACEAGVTYEHRFRADAGALFSLDAVGTPSATGGPHPRFPILAIGVGLRWHRLESRDIPAPRTPRPVPVPGRWPWPGRPEG
jgi:hypothetical protein